MKPNLFPLRTALRSRVLILFERNINTRRNGRRQKTASRETTNAALTHGARDKEKHIPTRMPVCDCGALIGQQLSTIGQQFFSFFFFLVKTLTLGGVGDAVALNVKDTFLYVLAGGGGIVLQLTVIHSSLFIDCYL